MISICLPGQPEFLSLLMKVARQLEDRGWMMATAESCTGGWIAKCCTDLAGSSAWFERGFVTYSNNAKQRMLGVSPDSLVREGAVSETVALEMAEGARREADVNVAISVTGIAGPDGGTPDKPVGTVWFGWSVGQQPSRAEKMCFTGDRDGVRRQSVGYSLTRLLKLLDT